MALMALDLPALERPAKATSAPASGGNCAGAAALIRNRASSNRLMLSRGNKARSEEHTSELQSRVDLVCRLLLEKKKRKDKAHNKRKNKREKKRTNWKK